MSQRIFVVHFSHSEGTVKNKVLVARVNIGREAFHLYPTDQITVVQAIRNSRDSRWLVRTSGNTRNIDGVSMQDVDLIGQFPDRLIVRFHSRRFKRRNSSVGNFSVGDCVLVLVPTKPRMPRAGTTWLCRPETVIGESERGQIIVHVRAIEETSS